ncbi:MAG: DUF4358 domain-containing protein [Erysipelothrix sp.]|jgi:hypothetical protein|nr:DUF4358 domain-containing protein [Erysipelothrix sp.]
MKKLVVLFLTLGLLMGCAPTTPTVEVDIEDIAQAIKDEYGDDYAPSLDYDETYMVERLGIESGWVEAFFGQGPTFSTSSDELIIIKATEGNVAKVVAAMQEYQRYLKEESFQYPMNMPRVQNAMLVSEGDYVVFVLVGKFFEYPSDGSDYDEQEEIDFVKAQFQRGVDVFKSFFE